jgi:phage protein D
MSAITFDTLKFVERLEKAGASRELASALAEAQKEAFAEALETSLATKTDMGDVKLELARMDSKIDKLSWMMGILIALAIANFAKQFF